jgi:CheY-like chemotaxis protein
MNSWDMTKILLVEDDPILSQMYLKIFESESYEVVIAQDGDEGVAKTKSEKPDIVLLDIMLPKMSGIDVLELIKKDPETKEIPVVVLTNLAGEKDSERAMALGAAKYLIKNQYKPTEVEQIVKDVLSISHLN